MASDDDMSKFFTTITPGAFRALQQSKHGVRVVPLDATWYLPNVAKSAVDEFKRQRIAGAVYFDLDKVASESKYPHMLPSLQQFKLAMDALGINKDDKLVVYDRQGTFSGPRAAWTLSLYGHPKVYVLDNYLAYESHGYPIDDSKVDNVTPLPASDYEVIPEEEFKQNYEQQVIEYDELLKLVEDGKVGSEVILLDARPHARFTAETPEPRPGVKSGHIPRSKNLPFPKLLNEDKTFKSKQDLVKAFADIGIDATSAEAFLGPHKEVIVSCGSGTTAVIVKFAIQNVLGLDVPVRVYDGSWSEWGDKAPEELVVTGEA
ncbi:hypothetical protein DIURU_003535 [Diutina rugosa]|uniref:Sulfurtransferase n=1 Tax=Diutina rugosa TaxID=5481 RepID=A0A642UQI7_DIURU|nr:uncharacterized protein DIURU_003535 [Diutina rugosa]KAA8901165.1 hypothetical protein DIURU_003535 [Diutina rugosa]